VNACTKVSYLKASTRHLILSCEHGGNQIPSAYSQFFRHSRHILKTHRGLDIGALAVARGLKKRLSAPLLYSETSRLLVDLNRSLHHPRLFSEFTKLANTETKCAVLDKYYSPYRNAITRMVAESIAAQQTILHLSIHSFTPRFNDQIRTADIGLLYDPARPLEKSFCRDLQRELKAASNLIIRLNYPYRGNADGLTTSLRRQFPFDRYMGIEIEINQKLLAGKNNQQQLIARLLQTAIQTAIG